MKLYVFWSFLWALSGSMAARAADVDTNAAPLTLDWVLRQVETRNPSLKSVRARWEAMHQRVPQARAWEDPKVGVDIERSGTTRFDEYHNTEWMVSQEIPLSGRNRYRAQIASAEAAMVQSEADQIGLELFAQARMAYLRYANAQAQLEINLRNETLLREFASISLDKFALRQRTQTDTLMAETELALLLEQRRDFERDLSDARSRLNTLMNRPPQESLPAPEPSRFEQAALDLAELQARALKNQPGLIGVEQKLVAARSQVTLARRAWYPDPELRLEARQFHGQGAGIQEYDTGIFFKVPWLHPGKYRSAIAEARQDAESAAQELAARQSQTLGLVRDAVTKIQTLEHHYRIYRDRIVPLARQTTEAARAAYLNNEGTILELLAAQRAFQNAEATLEHHLTDYLAAIAELEPLVGTFLPLTPGATPSSSTSH